MIPLLFKYQHEILFIVMIFLYLNAGKRWRVSAGRRRPPKSHGKKLKIVKKEN
jgi:hypothetical protein